jgi:mannose-6-phosphate isomerase-like protein (cupin superfamily)
MARVPLELESSGVSYQRLEPNFRLPFGHTHKTQEEVYVLISGGARAKLGDEIVDLRPFDALRVHKDTLRSFEAGPEGAEMIAIGAPHTGPGDAEVVQDWWMD